MKKAVFIPLIAVGSLILTAGIFFGVGLIVTNHNIKQTMNVTEINDDVRSISVDVSVSDLEFKVANDGKSKIITEESNKFYHNALLASMFLAWLYEPIRGNHLFRKINAYRCWHEQMRQNLPLLVAYHKGKTFTGQTYKTIMAWKTFTSPADEFPALCIPRTVLTEQWMAVPPIVTKDGKRFFYLTGEMPASGTSQLCMVVDDEEHVCLRMLEIADAGGKTAEAGTP